MNLEIQSYKPGPELFRLNPDDGSGKAQIYTEFGVVKFFTFPGSAPPNVEHRAFTSLEMFFAGEIYHATIGRYYSPRWWRRLANKFALACCERCEEGMLHGK